MKKQEITKKQKQNKTKESETRNGQMEQEGTRAKQIRCTDKETGR